MSPSSNHLFLLFLLLVILLPVLLLLKVVRGHATRTISLIARATPLVFFEYSRASSWASRLFQAPTAHARTTTMGETSIPRRDENDRWNAFIRESEAAIEKYLVPDIDLELASFVRCITFRVFLVVFLGVDPDTLAFPNVQRVTSALSDFYNDGQGESTLPLQVQSILYEWLPRKRFPSSLDRILPAYEALWQIMATIVVACEDDETKALRWVMLDFRDNPRDGQYTASFGSDSKSVADITDDAVGRITPFAPPQHATTSTWPLNCIQYASASSSTPGYPPTVREALKFAALLASMVIGRVGVHYVISGGGATGGRTSPWDQRKISGVNRTPPGHIAIGVVETPVRPHASSSRQVY